MTFVIIFLDDETHLDGVNEEDDAKKRNRSRRLAASKALVANSDFDWDVKATGSGSANRHSLDSSVGSHTTPGAALSGSTDSRRNTPAAAASSQSKKRGRPPGSKNSTPKAKKSKISRPSQSAEDDGRGKIDRLHYVILQLLYFFESDRIIQAYFLDVIRQ